MDGYGFRKEFIGEETFSLGVTMWEDKKGKRIRGASFFVNGYEVKLNLRTLAAVRRWLQKKPPLPESPRK